MDEARSSYCVTADSSYGLHSSSTTYTGNLVRAIIESLQHDLVMGSLRAASRIRYVEIEDSCDCITDDACDGVTAGSNIDDMNKKAEHARRANKFDLGLSQ
ncbi:hypothetical protein AMTR_s00209p00032240 [Amborella trichopoda]|uniref:Uncharacterized protein n=1 Tax=Amborella trichopoda TaxID=13333 RepID=W1P2J0_AMBTC|nr:hypothetical protein AMTR_s00209p00032240 [Amborella trichopoda]